jgi:xanthine/CO dehydrogenase XdhC/CoxF family maturation factor
VKLHGAPPCSLGSRLEVVAGGPVGGTLGCAEFDEAAAAIAPEILASGEPEVRTLHHDLGEIEVLFEPVLGPPLLVIVSATDVARELQAIALRIGSDPVLVEPRGERVRPEDRQLAWRIVRAIDPADLDARSEVVFTDHDAPDLVEQLAGVLRSAAGFVGVMGSRRHVGPYLEELRTMGFSAHDLERVRSPLGLDLGGRRPPEVALSIAAGLVAARHGRVGGWLHARG